MMKRRFAARVTADMLHEKNITKRLTKLWSGYCHEAAMPPTLSSPTVNWTELTWPDLDLALAVLTWAKLILTELTW